MPAKMIDFGKYKHFSIALLEEEGEKFFRIRSFDPKSEFGDVGRIERLDVNTARCLAKFIGRH